MGDGQKAGQLEVAPTPAALPPSGADKPYARVGILASIPIDLSKQRQIRDKYAARAIGSNARAKFGPHFSQNL